MKVLDRTTGQWKQIALGSELKNDLTSDAQTMAPTVHAVNEGIKNKINGDGSIGTIVECTFEEYRTLKNNNQIDEDTEYHINDLNNTISTDLQSMIVDNLITEDSGKALSANQGVKLKTLYEECQKSCSGMTIIQSVNSFSWSCSGNTADITHFPFNSTAIGWGQSNEFFTFNNGYVTIGRNVNTIKVSIHVNANQDEKSGKFLMGYIRKNGNPYIRTISPLSKWAQLNTECILSVSEGDNVDFGLASDYSGTIVFPTYDSSNYSITSYGGMNYMTVEVIN